MTKRNDHFDSTGPTLVAITGAILVFIAQLTLAAAVFVILTKLAFGWFGGF